MTIPTRDELIERAELALNGDPSFWRIADLLDTEIRRAVAEELEELRDSMSAKWELSARILIDARLAALRQTEQPPGSSERPKLDAGTPATASTSPVECGPQRPEVAGSTPAPGATKVAAPALSPSQADMDALSKACRLVAERAGFGGWLTPKTVEALNHRADHLEYLLRAASAPEPEDAFDVTARRALKRLANIFSRHDIDWLANMLRDRFGPLDQLLSEIEVAPGAWQTRAAATRAALRQRAQEASR